MNPDQLKQNARLHFSNHRTPDRLVEIKVPEWKSPDGVVPSIFYWPVRSISEKRAIMLAAHTGVSLGDMDRKFKPDNLAAHVSELIMRARDEIGRRLFSEEDRDTIMEHFDPEVVARVSREMRDEDIPSEDFEKK